MSNLRKYLEDAYVEEVKNILIETEVDIIPLIKRTGKEDDEFLELVYKTGVPVYYNNRITILDKKTNKIIDVSGIHHR